MSLTCECGEWDMGPGSIGYYLPTGYTVHKGKRRIKCDSCGAAVAPGDTCTKWPRYKIPESEVEIRIYGEDGEIERSPLCHCERCADLYFSLAELGYCVDPQESMPDLVKEYAAMEKEEREAGKEEA